ncbi:MAG: GTPase ObgE [Lachnospiraceae bacterium]
MFADRAKIIIRSGKGGDGHVSFRRELYVPDGGPDGGDGGRGGDVVFEVDEGLNTLVDFRHKRKFHAQDGEPGSKKRCHGGNGSDIVLKVPEGTVILDADTAKVIADMSGSNRRQIILKGGRGGKGNMNYATPTMQAPKYAQPGQPSKELEVRLELKVIADVGLVGFPNVGKSTLLSRVSNARPKIANYHFTTLNPNLGVVDFEGINDFVIADIPGLIEGASEGVGLGHDFLRHIERTRVMIHMVDAASTEGRDPIEDIYLINKEIAAYNSELAAHPQVIAANKIDAIYDITDESESPIALLKKEFEPKGIKVFPISAVSGKGIRELLSCVKEILSTLPKKPVQFEPEFFPEEELLLQQLPHSVYKAEDEEIYVIEGPRIEKMLGYTNLESEKGFAFFQRFLKETGILDELEALGIQEGDTVRMYGFDFDYYK